MIITLDSNPSDAPGCIKIIADNGQDILIQTDWDWPGIASTFGWSISSVPLPPDATVEACDHNGTDGTIDCPCCGLKAGAFITAARNWIDDNDGSETSDPGYFESKG